MPNTPSPAAEMPPIAERSSPAAHVFRPASKVDLPIDLIEARSRHIEYLEHGPYTYVNTPDGQKILHSLQIDRSDLELLYRNAPGGVRLLFCREKTGELNIIAAAVAADNNLNLTPDPHTGQLPIANSLSPCPHICTNDFSENRLNCWVNDGTDYTWIDPNYEQDGKIWFKEGPHGERVYVDAPAGAPQLA